MKTRFLETIKILDGKVYNIAFHQARYESVLHSFGVKDFRDLKTFIQAPLEGLYRCRLTYTPQNDINVSYHSYKKRSVKTLKILHDDSIDYGFKYEQRDSLNKLFDLREKCDDILIVKDGLVTDTSIANIAFFDGLNWLTPKKALLDGTTRRRYLESEKIIEKDIKVEDLKKFSKIALLNAMIDFDIIPNICYNYEG